MDTFNKFFVSVQSEDIVILRPPADDAIRLSKPDALILAAWLVALADDGEFNGLLEAVRST